MVNGELRMAIDEVRVKAGGIHLFHLIRSGVQMWGNSQFDSYLGNHDDWMGNTLGILGILGEASSPTSENFPLPRRQRQLPAYASNCPQLSIM
jgi:hypothetical protein